VKYLPLLFLLASCAPLTELQKEEREYRSDIDRENWYMCNKAYSAHGAPTIHYDHRHGRRDNVRSWDIKSDLMVNQCRSILGEAWADY